MFDIVKTIRLPEMAINVEIAIIQDKNISLHFTALHRNVYDFFNQSERYQTISGTTKYFGYHGHDL